MPDATSLINTLKLQAGITLPFEQVIVAILDTAARTRETMSQENRDRQDKLTLDFSEAIVRRIIRVMDDLDTAMGVEVPPS